MFTVDPFYKLYLGKRKQLEKCFLSHVWYSTSCNKNGAIFRAHKTFNCFEGLYHQRAAHC